MTTLTLPSAKLYWGIIDRPPAGAGPQAIRFAFEGLLPLPIDDAEIRFSTPVTRPGANDVVIGCAIERVALDALIIQHESAGVCVEHSIPDGWPAFILESIGCPLDDTLLNELEFRTGAFQSPRARQRDRKTYVAAAAALVLISTSLAMGWLGQASKLHDETAMIQSQSAQRITEHLGTAQGAAAALSPELRLTAELRGLRQSRNQSATPLLSEDRLATFLELLDHWPQEIPTRADTLQIDQDSITLRGLVRSPQDYEALNDALRGWLTNSGWTSPAGSSSRAGEAHAFTLATRRARGTSRAGGGS